MKINFSPSFSKNLTEAFQKGKFDACNQIVCAPIHSLTSRQDKHKIE
jgi:hypothetical protein